MKLLIKPTHFSQPSKLNLFFGTQIKLRDYPTGNIHKDLFSSKFHVYPQLFHELATFLHNKIFAELTISTGNHTVPIQK